MLGQEPYYMQYYTPHYASTTPEAPAPAPEPMKVSSPVADALMGLGLAIIVLGGAFLMLKPLAKTRVKM